MNDHNASNDSEAMTTRERKRARIMKELESLEEDNSGKMERDRMVIWRKLQKTISRNDDISNEYVLSHLFYLSLIYRRVCQVDIVFNAEIITKI